MNLQASKRKSSIDLHSKSSLPIQHPLFFFEKETRLSFVLSISNDFIYSKTHFETREHKKNPPLTFNAEFIIKDKCNTRRVFNMSINNFNVLKYFERFMNCNRLRACDRNCLTVCLTRCHHKRLTRRENYILIQNRFSVYLLFYLLF